MKSLIPSRPVLWFLFLFNLAVAIAAGIVFDGSQRLMTSAGMGAVAFGAGAGLVLRRSTRPDTRQPLTARK